jgi:hypothetical protein
MKVAEMIQVLIAAAEMYGETGNTRAADALRSFTTLLEGHENKTISAFTSQFGKPTQQKTLRSGLRKSR